MAVERERVPAGPPIPDAVFLDSIGFASGSQSLSEKSLRYLSDLALNVNTPLVERIYAIRTLAGSEDPKAIETLARIFKNEYKFDIRLAALQGLVHTGHASAVPCLVRAFESPENSFLEVVIPALPNFGRLLNPHLDLIAGNLGQVTEPNARLLLDLLGNSGENSSKLAAKVRKFERTTNFVSLRDPALRTAERLHPEGTLEALKTLATRWWARGVTRSQAVERIGVLQSNETLRQRCDFLCDLAEEALVIKPGWVTIVERQRLSRAEKALEALGKQVEFLAQLPDGLEAAAKVVLPMLRSPFAVIKTAAVGTLAKLHFASSPGMRGESRISDEIIVQLEANPDDLELLLSALPFFQQTTCLDGAGMIVTAIKLSDTGGSIRYELQEAAVKAVNERLAEEFPIGEINELVELIKHTNVTLRFSAAKILSALKDSTREHYEALCDAFWNEDPLNEGVRLVLLEAIKATKHEMVPMMLESVAASKELGTKLKSKANALLG